MKRVIDVIRQRLRMIRYYSAPRRLTGLARATDVALITALLLAIPVTILCDTLFVRPAQISTVAGRLITSPGGQVMGAVDRTSRLEQGWPEGDLLGTFAIRLEQSRRGWPLTTSVAWSAVIVDLDIFAEPAPRVGVALAEDDPLRVAIDGAMVEEGETEMLAALRTGRLPAQHRAAGWLAGATLWLILLCVVSVFMVRTGWFGWAVLRGRGLSREARRKATGQCVSCGYDLRGLEYSERCPECGTLAY